MERRTSQLLLLLLLLSLMLLGSFPNAGVAARKLLTQEEEEEESTATVQGEAHEVAEGAPPTPSATAKTITFFLHHVVGGPNSVGGVGVENMNGPLPLTIPAGALPGNNGVGVGVGSIGGGQFPLPFNGVATPGLGLGNNIVPGSSSSSFSFQNGGQSLPFPSTNVNGPLQNPLLGASGVPFPNGNGVGLKNGMEIEGPLTEGPDLHSAQIGSGKGYFFMPSSPDAAAEEGDESLLLLSFTAKFQGGGSEYEGSSVELWGKVESGKEEVEIGVVGGSGELENARGHAIIHTVSSTPLETTLEFTVNLTHY